MSNDKPITREQLEALIDGNKPPTITSREQLREMTPTEIITAQDDGRIDYDAIALDEQAKTAAAEERAHQISTAIQNGAPAEQALATFTDTEN